MGAVKWVVHRETGRDRLGDDGVGREKQCLRIEHMCDGNRNVA